MEAFQIRLKDVKLKLLDPPDDSYGSPRFLGTQRRTLECCINNRAIVLSAVIVHLLMLTVRWARILDWWRGYKSLKTLTLSGHHDDLRLLNLLPHQTQESKLSKKRHPCFDNFYSQLTKMKTIWCEKNENSQDKTYKHKFCTISYARFESIQKIHKHTELDRIDLMRALSLCYWQPQESKQRLWSFISFLELYVFHRICYALQTSKLLYHRMTSLQETLSSNGFWLAIKFITVKSSTGTFFVLKVAWAFDLSPMMQFVKRVIFANHFNKCWFHMGISRYCQFFVSLSIAG
jgi:hypothetical protein